MTTEIPKLNCPKCQQPFEMGCKFCSGCGLHLEKELVSDPTCPKCGKEFSFPTAYCDVDGAKLVSKKKLIPRCSKCLKEYPSGTKFCVEDGGQIISEAFQAEQSPSRSDSVLNIKSEMREIPQILQGSFEPKIARYFTEGWQIFCENIGGFIGFTFLLVMVLGLGSLLPEALAGGTGESIYSRYGVRAAFREYQTNYKIIATIIGQLSLAAYIVMVSKIVKRRQTEFLDFFRGFKFTLPILGAALATNILSFIGLIIFIIPGIYLSTSFLFVYPLIVDRNQNIIDAMRVSREVVGRKFFPLFGMCFLLLLINLLGMLPYYLGVFFTLPYCICVWLASYNDIFGFKENDFLS